MPDVAKAEKNNYLSLSMEIEKKKHEYKVQRRQLVWFFNLVIADAVIFAVATTAQDYLGRDSYVATWCNITLVIAVILTIILFVHFFNIAYYIACVFFEYGDEKFGFQGIDRIKTFISLKDEIEAKETALRILEKYQTHKLSVEEQYDLYKDELLQAISQYQQEANRNRNIYFVLQMIIIASSLFVGGLTSGLNNLITFFGNHWLAPALSFTISFLTAMVTLFRPRERSYNLQQTADAIQYEISCADRRIYAYKEMDDRQAYTKLAEEVERLRNEQRKRQQQLEQSSEVKHAPE
jgi:hypothetical protein